MSDRPLYQSLLDIGFSDSATFDNFIGAGDVVSLLREQCRGAGRALQLVYLWGDRFTGRSHLLQAACNEARLQGRRVVYLPLSARSRIDPARLAGIGGNLQLCLDDLDLVCGDAVWEEALFHLCNEARDSGSRVLIAARVPPTGLEIELADLKSRLAAALVLRITLLSDTEKERAIRHRAARRGLEISAETVRYIMTHTERDMASLVTILDELDRESVLQQRRVTIPFLKKVLRL